MAALADAPIGDPDAPIGSVDRIYHARLCAQSLANDLHKAPERFVSWWEELCESYPNPKKPGKKIYGWQMVCDASGARFPTLKAFCEYRQPWGLGRSLATINAYMRALAGPHERRGPHVIPIDPAKKLALAGAVDGRASNGANALPGTKGFAKPVSDSGHRVPNHKNDGEDKEAKRLRAISRAPAPLPLLWTADLVSKTVAVAASGASEAVGAAAEAVLNERGVPTNDTEKRETRRLVDAAVRETAGVTKPTHTLATITTIFRAWWATASANDRDAFADVVQAAQRSHQ